VEGREGDGIDCRGLETMREIPKEMKTEAFWGFGPASCESRNFSIWCPRSTFSVYSITWTIEIMPGFQS
jgi:hypothetical protein